MMPTMTAVIRPVFEQEEITLRERFNPFQRGFRGRGAKLQNETLSMGKTPQSSMACHTLANGC